MPTLAEPRIEIEENYDLKDLPEPISLARSAPKPSYEIVQNRRAQTIVIDLPGVLADNLHVSCQAGRILVWGHRSRFGHAGVTDLFCNRWQGAFALELPVPNWVDPKRISRKYENGVLWIELPKRRESIHRES